MCRVWRQGWQVAMGVLAVGLVGCGGTAVPQGAPAVTCDDSAPCGTGLDCVAGGCVPRVATPTVELGLTGAETGTFTRLESGASLPLYTGEQWGHHVLMTVRATEFPPAEFFRVNVMVGERVTVIRTGEIVAESRSVSEFLQHPDGLTEMVNRIIFLDVPLGSLDDELVAIDMTLTALDDERITADLHYEFVLTPAFGSVNPVER